jgi:FG-GAP repeat
VWTRGQKLVAANRTGVLQFGLAVALDEETALIGAPQADVKGFNSAGAVYVFKREAGTWKDWQILTADPDQNYEALGAAVALDGDTLFAGAPGKFASGAVIVYVRNGATWQQQPAIKLSDAEEYESLGVSADLDGDTAIVGSSARYGAAYIYRQDGSSWKMQQKLVGSRSLDWDNFGVSVAVDGETAVVGASREDKAYLFQWDGAKWTLGQELEQTDASFSAMGKAVDLYGDMAVVGAVHAKIGADGNQCAVYVFTRGATDWTRTQKILPPPGPKPALFGYPSLDDGRLLVGAPGDDFWCTGVRRFAYFFESAKFVQYIDFPTPSVAGVGNVVPLSAKASSGLPIDYVSNTADTCSVSGNMATMLTRGKCSITASQDGDEKFAAAQNVTVNFATAGDNYRLYLPGVFIDLE